MADNNDRLDLNGDLDKLSNDLLKDVKAATEEVKHRKATDAAKDRRSATRDKDRLRSVIAIAAAAVILILIAYWTMFGRQPQNTVNVSYTQPQAKNTKIVQPQPLAPTQRPVAPRPAPRSNQPAPPNEYDQPGQ